MLGFIRHWIPYQGLPIGVDLGTNAIRLAQVENGEQELRLVHAAEFQRSDASGNDRWEMLRSAFKSTLREGRFRGRSVVVGLDAADVHIKHVRMPRVTGEEFNQALNEQAESVLGSSPADFAIRGVVVGDIFGEQQPQQEVVLFATPQSIVQDLLETAASARVQIVGVHVQQRITAESFARHYRRKADETAVNLFVDLGHGGTRAFVASPSELRFVRTMPLSVSQLHDKIARSLNLPVTELDGIRRSIGAQSSTSNNLVPQIPTFSDVQRKLIDETNTQAARLVDELEMCRRYYEATIPDRPVTRLIFIGGGARDRLLCAAIAQAMSLPAQIGDALVRFNRVSLPSLACIDRREPMPQWSVALGLSLCGQSVASI